MRACRVTNESDPNSADALDYDGKTPLFKSAKYNQYFTASLLLSKKASVNATDLNGETPLHIAAGNGAAEMIKLLLEHGADPEAANMHGQNPVHFCARYSVRPQSEIGGSFCA